MKTTGTTRKLLRLITILGRKAETFYRFCLNGVWNEEENTAKIKLLKIVNLSIRSFLDRDLQMRSCALTYRTMLAIVPLMAMLFAIGRGFGFQNIIKSELLRFFPAQSEVLREILVFVDSYLEHSSEGIFVGIGVLFLLWTLISLLSHVEETFNNIWDIKKGRSFVRKLTDYTAICLFLPILLICSGGISIYMSTTVQSMLPYNFLSPVVTFILDIAPFFLTCLFFIGAYVLVPNTKVKFKNAIVAGGVCGTAIQLLQILFVNGQIYVSGYNAIYGSFAFLPLLLIWTQLSWLICLSGVVITYSVQNVVNFNFHENIKGISRKYLDEITIVVLALIIKRFQSAERPYTAADISKIYHVPTRLCHKVLSLLKEMGFIAEVRLEDDAIGYQPAFNIEKMTVESVRTAINSRGLSNFLPDVDRKWHDALKSVALSADGGNEPHSEICLKDLPLTVKR